MSKNTRITITYVPSMGGIWWSVVGTAQQGWAPSQKLAESDAKAAIAGVMS